MKERKQMTDGEAANLVRALRNEEEALKWCFLWLLSSFSTGSESVPLNPPALWYVYKSKHNTQTHTQTLKRIKHPAQFPHPSNDQQFSTASFIHTEWQSVANTGNLWSPALSGPPVCHVAHNTKLLHRQAPGLDRPEQQSSESPEKKTQLVLSAPQEERGAMKEVWHLQF